jgi:hypothetical protein
VHTSDQHPTDEDLLRAADGELPHGRQQRMDGHLRACTTCRARAGQFARTSLEIETLYRNTGTDDHSRSDARVRIHATLAAAAARPERVSTRLAGLLAAPRWVASPAAVAVALAAIAVFAVTTLGPAPSSNTARGPAVVEPGVETGVEPGALPVAVLTPGATVPMTVQQVCEGATPDARRPLPAALRQQVLRDYRMEHVPDAAYELDYLITPELGGAPDARNLWPQRYGLPTWNARVKDQLEDLLPRLVCGGQLDLATAQRDIAADWIAAYRKYFKTEYPLIVTASLSLGRN